jgi:hypothetical protein
VGVAGKLVLQPVFKDVSHGHELDRAAAGRGKSIGGRAGAASATADQGHLDRVVLRGVDVGSGHAGQGRGGDNTAGVL